MMCFGFTGPAKELCVELCEEVIVYRTLRSEGVPMVGNIIVRSLTPAAKYLGIWHRADVAPFLIDETPKWLDEDDINSDLFFNLAKARGEVGPGKSSISVRLFSGSGSEEPRLSDEVTTDIMVANDDIRVSHPLQDEASQLDPSIVPYTYAKIGPFSGQDRYYAIRVTATIRGDSFDRLVIENPLLGTRYYQIYGVEEILNSIRQVDMPRLKRLCGSGSVLSKYEGVLQEGLGRSPLRPRFYSIVAVDSLRTRLLDPKRVYMIHIQKALRELDVDSGGFKHPELKELKDRVFWFVNKGSSQDFLLWLEGPMGETQGATKDVAAGARA